MKVINIHKRTLYGPIEKLAAFFMTLATYIDLAWPFENCPILRFKDGLKVGIKAGHGCIRYTIINFKEDKYAKFMFSKPEGFNGTHEFKIIETLDRNSEIIHEIKMQISTKGTLFWVFIIRWLHDALMEDAFDKVENYFAYNIKKQNIVFGLNFHEEPTKENHFKLNTLN
tara:strand:+ start:160 stop:669 length:510 start_codon:yes stop_codon:yes gene_type:complete